MKIVIVTGDGPEHCYVANRISEKHDVAAILVCDPTPRRHWKKVLKKSPIQFINKTLRTVFLKLVGDGRSRSAALEKVFGAGHKTFRQADLISHVGRPKAGKLAQTVRALEPDIIAVYGTGIIPDDVLDAAKTVSLNMHTGLSPWYRGTACAFWPIAMGEPEMIGATVHECTSDVDGGRIFQTKRAEIYKGDDLHVIFARAAVAGTDAYIDVINAVKSGTLAGQPQDLAQGREFRGNQLGIFPELKARWQLWKMSKILPKGEGYK